MTPLGQFLDPALVQRLNQLELPARSVVEGAAGGSRRSIQQGASIEFAQHRPFAFGDEPRRLDWRVLARTGKLFVREDQEETNARVLLTLDQSGSMTYGKKFGTKLRYAQRVLAALAYLLLGRREAVGFATISESIDDWLAISAAGTQLATILDTLGRSRGRQRSDPGQAMGLLATRLVRRSLVVIASDLFMSPTQLNDALARLRHGHHEVIVLRVLDADEKTFPFRASVQFRGLESEPSLLRNASLARANYLLRFARHSEALTRLCAKHGVELHEFVTDVPLEEAVIRFLSRRMRVDR